MVYVEEFDLTDLEIVPLGPVVDDEDLRAFVEYELQDAAAAHHDFLCDAQDPDFPFDIAAELQAVWDNAIREYKARMMQRHVNDPCQEDWELESRRQEARFYTDLADWESRE